jgi:hypothetical protein
MLPGLTKVKQHAPALSAAISWMAVSKLAEGMAVDLIEKAGQRVSLCPRVSKSLRGVPYLRGARICRTDHPSPGRPHGQRKARAVRGVPLHGESWCCWPVLERRSNGWRSSGQGVCSRRRRRCFRGWGTSQQEPVMSRRGTVQTAGLGACISTNVFIGLARSGVEFKGSRNCE